MVDAPPTSESHPDKVFIWVDEDGVRCSPRHWTIKAALNFYKDREGYWAYEDGKSRRYDRDLSSLPSQKQPKKLQVGEWLYRDFSEDEFNKVEQVRELIAEGLV